MSDFVSVDRINALKSGIEAKTGGTYADLTESVQALVDGYGQGGGGGVSERTAWYRPPDMPDYDALIADKSIFEDDYPNQSVIHCFYTIDTKIPNRTTISPRKANGTFEIGHFHDGEFVADETINFPYDLTRHTERYIILRQTKGSLFGFSDKALPNFALNPIVEIYGRLNGINMSGEYNKNPQRLPTVRFVTLFGTVNFGTGAYTMIPLWAEYIDLSHATIPDISGRMFDVSAFSGCINLHTLLFPNGRKIATQDQFNLQYSRFQNLQNITALDLSMWDMSGITDLQKTFNGDVSLKSLDISGWDMSSCTKTTSMFDHCYSLTDIITKDTIFPSISFSLSNADLLTVESLVGVIAALPALDGKTATLTLNATSKAKLTEDQIAVATAKGWTIA